MLGRGNLKLTLTSRSFFLVVHPAKQRKIRQKELLVSQLPVLLLNYIISLNKILSVKFTAKPTDRTHND